MLISSVTFQIFLAFFPGVWKDYTPRTLVWLCTLLRAYKLSAQLFSLPKVNRHIPHGICFVSLSPRMKKIKSKD